MLEGVGERVAGFVAPLTSRGRVVVFVSSLFAVLGFLGVGGGLFLSLSVFLFSFLVVSRIVFGVKSSVLYRLVVSRRVEGPLVEGRVARVVVSIVNPTPVSLDSVFVEDFPPRLFRAGGAARRVFFLPGYSRVELSYPVRLVLGYHEWGGLVVATSDWLGLFRAERVAGGGFSVSVKPRALGVPRRGLVSASFLPAGVARAGRRGGGVVFYSLRDYFPEDDVRVIDWKAYARLRRLFVKEYEQEVVFHSIVVLDVTPTSARGVVGETKLEYSARIAASLASYFALRGDYYRIAVVQPDGGFEATRWLRGRRSVVEAYSVLGSARWPRGRVESPYASRVYMLRERIAGMLPREKTIIVFVSDFYEEPVVASLYSRFLGRLASLRHEVVAVIPLTLFFELRVLGEGRRAAIYRAMAYRAIESYREVLKTLRSSGVRAVAAGPSDLASYLVERLEAMRGVFA